jgi:carboxyl-terminal processing protease
MHRALLRRLAVAVTLLGLCFSGHPVSAQSVLPDKTAEDVRQSFQLLETTPYHSVEPNQLIDAARAAMVQYAHDHGATIVVPPIADTGDDDAAINALNAAIANAAQAAHGDPTLYAYAAIDGMAATFDDRYTQFMTPDEYRQFTDALDPERISGIGVIVSSDPATSYIRLSYVLPNTPAERAGLRNGDYVVSIDGTSTKGFTVDDARKMLRGKAGTLVTLGISQASTGTPHDVSVTRSEVQPPTVIFKMLPENIGYAWVLDFGRTTPLEFDTALRRLQAQGARALVLDLRNDTGGYVDSALEISSHFVGDQAILTVEQRDNRDETIDSDNREAQIALPTTVLVNGYTASASEITAGALQDDGAAILIGTKTFGKGVMQTLTELADGAAIKITTAHYLTPRRRDINLRGIVPDLSVDENHDPRFGELDSDSQLRAAVSYLQKKIAAAPRAANLSPRR